LIDTPGGGHVRLGEVADIRIAPTPISIQRDAVSRYLDVTANISGRSFGAVTGEISNSLEEIDFPLEYRAEILGDYAQQQAAQQRILLFSAVAVIGIFLLLQASFWSWHLALAAFVTILASLSGGVLAALVAGGEISLGSLFGFLILLGLATRFVIVLFHHMQNLELNEAVEFGPELVIKAATDRLTPMLMTSSGLGVLFLPFLVAGAIPGLEFFTPMAIVILGGMVTNLFLVLFVSPALYLRYGLKREFTPEIKSEHVPAA
ncbi:MAG: efflux RND transporter permease subunit, partial [Anaerolineales bacterium]